IFTEVLDDVVIRLAPLTRETAAAMLDDLRGRRVLDGVRGRPAVDRSAIADLLVALSRLALQRPDILEVDLNPVIATPEGALAVDALVVLAGRSSEALDA
ncbi:MAG: acetate--CoA ligase family protein, partial [Chloroflexota bacterium]|nr:acetate--CoA ligase family protein [Chloroflexota bacterium]